MGLHGRRSPPPSADLELGALMKPSKARLDLIELVKECLMNGPVPLHVYAKIVGCKTTDPASWERSARRLVAKLKAQNHRVIALGDAERLTLDFSQATALLRGLPESKALSPPRSKRERSRAQRVTPEQMTKILAVMVGPAIACSRAIATRIQIIRSAL